MWLSISAVWLAMTMVMATLLSWILGRFLRTVETPEATSGKITAVDLETKTRSCKTSFASESCEILHKYNLHKYDVFINHRGPDVKTTFAADLSAALSRAGFIPFLDAKSIAQGRHVFKSIDEALSGACVHVAIFSKRYAESKYCLDELADMVHSGKVILPVFYDVKPQHLRWVGNGPFAEGFRKHEKNKRQEKVLKWKDALQKVSQTMGFVVNGDESEVVRSIVVAVRNAMPVSLQPQKRRFGLEESLKDVFKRLDMMKESQNVLGLVGMGGIGKTTLASEIYNHFVSHREFQYHCFLKDVRSSVPSELRRQLLRDLIQEDLNSPEEYQHKFEVCSRQRVLIIVDDIDNESQFTNLIPDIQLLGSGSRIIITSRHRDVLNITMRRAISKYIYEVKLLSRTDSQRLFNWNAFDSETPSTGFGDLAAKVAEACGGHPLALEVIGASLFDKREYPDDTEIWVDAVKTLNENEDILGKLRISYDCLPTEGDKAMFRDIACLLNGMPDEVAMMIWTSCNSCSQGFCVTSKTPHLVLRRLLDKSLVKLDSGRLSMHDVIRDMGRDVVIRASPKPEGRTHLWDTTTAAKVLRKNKGTNNVRGIRLFMKDIDGTQTCAASQFSSMEELHLLVLDNNPIVPDDFSRWSEVLRWLQWKSLPFTELPSQLNLPKLTVLDLTDSGNLTRLWHNDASIQFPSLQMLILANCRALEELPQNIGQSLPKLKRMDMNRCSLIAVLPDSVGQLKHLEELVLSDCENLMALPDTIVNLRKLRKLHLDNSPVKDLPEDFGQLMCLTSLTMLQIRSVPETFGDLTSLSSLYFGSSDLGGRFATSLGALTALKNLHLCNNSNITALPGSFGDLKSLVHLEMTNCSALVTIAVLPRRLKHLALSHCPQLMDFPSLAEMSSLVHLDLCTCTSLTFIHGLECLTALEFINLGGVTQIADCMSVTVQSGHHVALRNCCLSGSKVAVAYDNRWLERKPALQLISYYDDSIGYFPNGMARTFVNREWTFEVLISATIATKAECIALLVCVIAHDQGWASDQVDCANSHTGIEVQIMRQGKVVTETGLLTLRHADGRNQVYLWTLRREHPVVQSLQDGDKVCVCARSLYPGWKITVLEGAICTIHEEEDHLILAVNSELLSRSHSQDLATKLGQLVLADNVYSSLKSELENDEIDCAELGPKFTDFLASEKDTLNEHAANPASVSEIMIPQQEWLIAPAYGHYHWTRSWKLPREGQGIISFEILCRNSVHVAISATRNDPFRSCMYEIIIGSWENTTSVIQRYSGRGAEKCCSFAAELTHPQGLNRLWVSIDHETSLIQVGRGKPCQEVIAIYRDSSFLSTVQNVSFTSSDTPVTYSSVVITGVEHIPPLLNTYRLSEKMFKPVANGKWVMAAKFYGDYTWAQHWMLPRAGRGIFSFVAEESCHEVYVAISARPYTMDPMYEIVIGGYNKRLTVLRKRSQGSVVCQTHTDHLITSPVNQFWVLIDDRTGTIRLGRGEPGQDMFFLYKDTDFLLEAQYCTFTNYHIPVTFSNVAITAILDP